MAGQERQEEEEEWGVGSIQAADTGRERSQFVPHPLPCPFEEQVNRPTEETAMPREGQTQLAGLAPLPFKFTE